MAALNAQRVHSTAEALALAFNQSFAAARRNATVAVDDFLAIRLDGRPHALRLGEIAGLHELSAVTHLPSPVPELRGITGLRGTILPVYDLAAVIGLPPARTLRWFVITQQEPVALAVESFDGHFRVLADDVVADADAGATSGRDVVRSDGVTRPLIRLPAVVASIRRLSGQPLSSRNA